MQRTLEPDILIVDEVLAVGDVEFQKKAIGKMRDISNSEGRTVLFVSHDMDAILKLTSRVILLVNGKVIDEGLPQEIINNYTLVSFRPQIFKTWAIGEELGNKYAKLKSISVTNNKDVQQFDYDVTENIKIKINYLDLNKEYKNTAIVHVIDEFDRTIFASNEFDAVEWLSHHDSSSSLISAACIIPGNLLQIGRYKVLIAIGNYNPNMIHVKIDEALTFNVINKSDVEKYRVEVGGNWPGLIRPILNWEITSKTI